MKVTGSPLGVTMLVSPLRLVMFMGLWGMRGGGAVITGMWKLGPREAATAAAASPGLAGLCTGGGDWGAACTDASCDRG